MVGPETIYTLGIDIGGTSVKAMLLDRSRGEREVRAARSEAYARPGRDELAAAIADVGRKVLAGGEMVSGIGVCAPGLRDESGMIVRAVNVPGLEGSSVVEMIEEAVIGPQRLALASRRGGGAVFEFADAHAAAVDFRRLHPGAGRLLALSLGTGVGACVLDEGVKGEVLPLIVSGAGPGHIGHMDVALEADAARVPIGPDGARGTLEAYMGLPALRARFGEGLAMAVEGGEVRADRAPLAALVRGLRIAHAIYRPRRVALLGGVGLALRPLAKGIRAEVDDGLTSLAQGGWTLEIGDDDLHAARGAAWMAAGASQG